MKLILGDCLEKMKDIPGKSIDMVLTSPPYGNLRNYNGSLDWDHDAFCNLANEILRVLTSGGVCVWIVNDKTESGTESGSSFRQALHFKALGLNLHDTMIWQKDSSVFPDKNRYYPIFEYMFVLSKGKPKTFNPIVDRKNIWGGRTKVQSNEYDHRGLKKVARRRGYTVPEYGVRHNIWRIPVGCGKSKEKWNTHPAVFPPSLAEGHIRSWSNEGDTILDPLMGSGTTGFVAKKLNRKFIGIEKESKYFDIAKERING